MIRAAITTGLAAIVGFAGAAAATRAASSGIAAGETPSAPAALATTPRPLRDIAPTILELAGVERPADMDGRSVLAALQGGAAGARASTPDRELLYEYYWEYAFPHTPTTFALRGDRFKYIYYQGVWDTNELFDLKTDPFEQHNLIGIPAYQDTVKAMRDRLFDRLEATGGMQVPLRRGDWQAAERKLP